MIIFEHTPDTIKIIKLSNKKLLVKTLSQPRDNFRTPSNIIWILSSNHNILYMLSFLNHIFQGLMSYFLKLYKNFFYSYSIIVFGNKINMYFDIIKIIIVLSYKCTFVSFPHDSYIGFTSLCRTCSKITFGAV